MKKILSAAIFFLLASQLLAQTDGISYQAVIIGPDKQELPGVDANGNILPDATIAIRFSILDATNTVVYQEVQTANTDRYGRLNLLIGKVRPNDFATIKWDGTPKDLKVDIDFKGTGNNFVDMSREQLTFLPYSYHRDITARGTLVVDGTTDLNGELKVQGPANFNSTFSVNNGNASNLSGSLNVGRQANIAGATKIGGATDLGNTLTVAGKTSLNDSFNVNNGRPAYFSGDLTVAGTTTFEGQTAFLEPITVPGLTVDGPSRLNDSLTVNGNSILNGKSNLNGQVTIDANVDANGTDTVYNAYPLLVQGSKQGIAVKVSGDRTGDNNFISFWDNNQMWGRIEGQTLGELQFDYQYERGRVKNVLDVAKAVTTALIKYLHVFQAGFKTVAASTSSTACVGLGACVTVPIPSLIVESISNSFLEVADAVLITYDLASTIENAINYEAVAAINIGVTYSSGAGDYAEWLPKEKPTDVFREGELVGIKNGKVTKKTWGVEKIMIVSTRPIVLGNMPQTDNENKNVKIAFMGQVPVTVLGKVEPGDYILPSILGNGFASSVNPKDMKPSDYKKVAGVAWNIIKQITSDLNIVNVAVGINTNDLSEVVMKQGEELMALKELFNQLKTQVAESNAALEKLIPGFASTTEIEKGPGSSIGADNKRPAEQKNIEKNIVHSNEEDIVYFQISREQIETGLALSREQYTEMLIEKEQRTKLLLSKNSATTVLDNIKLIPIEDHPFWKRIDNDPSYKEEIIKYIQSGLDKAYHTHKKYTQNFPKLKVRN